MCAVNKGWGKGNATVMRETCTFSLAAITEAKNYAAKLYDQKERHGE